MGKLLTKAMGNYLTTMMGNLLTEPMEKYLTFTKDDIYVIFDYRGHIKHTCYLSLRTSGREIPR